MPPLSANQAQRLTSKMASVPAEIIGQLGRRYAIQRTLRDNGRDKYRVFLATSGAQKFILKDLDQLHFRYVQQMHEKLRGCRNLRLPEDTAPEQTMFIYRYLSDDLLKFVITTDMPLTTTKRILKDALLGLQALHSRNIVHMDVKANNILVNRKGEHDSMEIDEVQLADLESAMDVPDGYDINGLEAGNMMWRSPEAHASAMMNKSSDIFSFGVVCIYAVLKVLVFGISKDEIDDDDERQFQILRRHISYFADEESMKGFLEYLGDSSWRQVFESLRDSFNGENPRKPFRIMTSIDEDFRDFISGLMNLDPTKRVSADEALAHKWLADV